MTSTIGLKRKTVALAAYDRRWPVLFAQEKKRLEKILSSYVVAIEHEGSTSVPGLMAKPIIDMLIGVRHIRKDGPRVVATLEKAGYHYRLNWSHTGQHILFAKGSEESRTHYIHIVKYRGVIWKRYLLFRDYLRTHPARAKQYERIKLRLAKKYPNDRTRYTAEKTDFIIETIRLARK